MGQWLSLLADPDQCIIFNSSSAIAYTPISVIFSLISGLILLNGGHLSAKADTSRSVML